VGDPTCILYYSTSGIPPGYYVTPNEPFQINASEGEVVQFYYTYSYNGLEANTSDNPHSYEIGSCNNSNLNTSIELLPENYTLHQNYPNPFNPITTLKYSLPSRVKVRLTIYDMMGEVVKTLIEEYQNPGYKSVQWDATNNRGYPVSAGVYLCNIEAGNFRQTKKMIFLK
jgi:hypothetical protein